MKGISRKYWEELYRINQTGWDVGYTTPPLSDYIDQLTNKSIQILVPGAGNGYEVEYLFKKGFIGVFLLDYSQKALNNFNSRVPEFPKANLIQQDFFDHSGQYDLILEQTFFCSLMRKNRKAYAEKMHDLLLPGGKLVGLMFNHEFGGDYPPFGGTEKEYRELFGEYLIIKKMETAFNSIKPRKGRELFFVLQKAKV